MEGNKHFKVQKLAHEITLSVLSQKINMHHQNNNQFSKEVWELYRDTFNNIT